MKNERGAGRKPKLNEDQLKHIIQRKKDGESIASLAGQYGLSRQALWKRIQQFEDDQPIQLDYMVEGLCITRMKVDAKRQEVRILNYGSRLSKWAFGVNQNPSWEELGQWCERQLFRKNGLQDEDVRAGRYLMLDAGRTAFSMDECLTGPESADGIHGTFDKNEVPTFEFTRKDLLLSRTDTDGFQMKALTNDRKWFVKSQAIMSGVEMNDWAVEIIASDLCEQLKIPCVKQRHCQFYYQNHLYQGVYSANFELDGFTFLSFQSLMDRQGIDPDAAGFISMNAIEKLQWCAETLTEISGISLKETTKYMLDLALIDCLVGNVDRHMKNYGLFFNELSGKYEIPLIFDNGMGLFEHDYYKDHYNSYEEAMRSVYVAPYGEDPFDMLEMLDEKYNLLSLYPGLKDLKYNDILRTPFALEYEERMMALWQK